MMLALGKRMAGSERSSAVTSLIVAACVLGAAGCGYQPIREPVAAQDRICPEVEASSVADALAVEAVAEGLRDALGRAGRLGACSQGANRVVVRLLELRVEPEGVVVAGAGPQSRGARATAVGEGEVLRQGQQSELGEAQVYVVAAPSGTAQMEGQLEQDVRVGAARSLGVIMGRRALGEASPSEIR
jgi:negative regulator of sigma E activity